MQLNTMATDSVKRLFRNSAPPTITSVGVMKLYLTNFTETPTSSITPQKQERKACNGWGKQTEMKKEERKKKKAA